MHIEEARNLGLRQLVAEAIVSYEVVVNLIGNDGNDVQEPVMIDIGQCRTPGVFVVCTTAGKVFGETTYQISRSIENIQLSGCVWRRGGVGRVGDHESVMSIAK